MPQLLRLTLAMGLAGLALAALAGALGPVAPAGAAPAGTVITNCTQAGLQTALSGGGSITFNCGGPKTITDTSVITIGLVSELDGGDAITLTGNLATRLFAINHNVNFKLAHIVLANADSFAGDGGAIANDGKLTLDHVTILRSHTDGNHSGGAIFTDGPLTITSSSFISNTAGSAGALFANFDKAVVAISDSTFSDGGTSNAATGYGGAIWVGEQAQVSISGGAITTNTARFGGGVYLSQDGFLTVTANGAPALISNNRATFAGGGIYDSQANVTLANVQLTANEARNFDVHIVAFGGAIDDVQGGLLATNTDIASNSADYGGGIYAISGTLTLTDPTLTHNTAITEGGGLNLSQSSLTLAGGDFISNTATQAGGGVFLDQSNQVSVTDTTLTDNQSPAGGGLYSQRSTTQLTHVTFSVNAAFAGGAAGFALSHANWEQVTLSGNSARDGGGALDVEQSIVTLNNSLLTGNHSATGGGVNVSNVGVEAGNGPAIAALAAFTLSNSSLSDNIATSGGGLYGASFARVNLLNDSVSANHASDFGGGVANATDSLLVMANTTLSGNTAQFGAGLDNLTGGEVTLTASTISSNTAQKLGGGIDAGSGHLTLVNATLSDNSAATGGGIFNDAAVVTLTNTTVYGNLASTAGGNLANNSAFFVASSLLAGPQQGGNCFQSAGSITSQGYNLSDDGTCAAFFTQTGDRNNTDARLGPLANHGGPTETHLPGAGSPAIDAIPIGANGCGTLLVTDQRGFARPFNGQCDIGAVEAPELWLPLIRR